MAPLTKLALSLLLGVEAARVRKHRDQSNASSARDWQPKLLPGFIDVKRPAFLMLDEEKKQVVISQFGRSTRPDTFNPLPLPAASSLSTISLSSLKSQLQSGRLSGRMGDDDIYVSTNAGLQWPNKLSRVPPGYGDYIVVPDGFLPPGKEDGNVFLADANGNIKRITNGPDNTFYHEVEWHDFNGDGLLDILTVRATKYGNVFSGFTFGGQMVWLENPGRNQMARQVWTEHYITKGPDVIFKSKPYNGGLAVFCTEFFNEEGPKISVRFLNSEGVEYDSRVIDDNLGKPFAIDIADLDDDGVDELLVTNHQGPDDSILPAVFAYEVDWNNLKGGRYTRHTLTYGPSENKVDDVGVGAPGFAKAFYPGPGMSGPKWIYAAGDGAYDVWILKPKGGRFQYETQIIDINGTTGEILMYDFDNDGVQDLLIPDNDFWGLYMITFE